MLTAGVILNVGVTLLAFWAMFHCSPYAIGLFFFTPMSIGCALHPWIFGFPFGGSVFFVASVGYVILALVAFNAWFFGTSSRNRDPPGRGLLVVNLYYLKEARDTLLLSRRDNIFLHIARNDCVVRGLEVGDAAAFRE